MNKLLNLCNKEPIFLNLGEKRKSLTHDTNKEGEKKKLPKIIYS